MLKDSLKDPTHLNPQNDLTDENTAPETVDLTDAMAVRVNKRYLLGLKREAKMSQDILNNCVNNTIQVHWDVDY